MDLPEPGLQIRQRNPNPLANYQFSSEELRVLRQCNSESFFQRSLPFGTGLGLAAYFGVKTGYLRASAKYGAVPKIVVGVIIGYFVGKFSYQQKCAEKLMALPNSRLAELLRQRKQGTLSTLTPEVGLALAPFAPNDQIGDQAGSALTLDNNRPTISDLDDFYRPSSDNPSYLNEPELPLEQAKFNTSYDELRRKNREEYEKKQQSMFSRPLSGDTPVVLRRAEPAQKVSDFNDEEIKLANAKKNKYGDVWSN